MRGEERGDKRGEREEIEERNIIQREERERERDEKKK